MHAVSSGTVSPGNFRPRFQWPSHLTLARRACCPFIEHDFGASLEQAPPVHCDTGGQVFKRLILMKDDPDVEVIRVLEMIFGTMDGVVLRWLNFGGPYCFDEAAGTLCLLSKPPYAA